MSDSIVGNKSFEFAVRIVNLCKILFSRNCDNVLCRQLLKSGTSIGANIREALNTQSQADFIHKFAIAQKECGETLYWLDLLKKAEYMSEAEYKSIHDDADELQKIVRSIILTSKSKSGS